MIMEQMLSAPNRLALSCGIKMPSTDTTLTRHSLRDILYQVRGHLIRQKAFKSLANLVKCNQEFRNIFSPGLQGWRVDLRGEEARDFFQDIIGSESPGSKADLADIPRMIRAQSLPIRTVRERNSRFGPYTSRRRWDEPKSEPWETSTNKQTNELHHRRLRILERCEVLSIHDFVGAEALVEAIIAAGDEEKAFQQVSKLCIGDELLWRLAERSDVTMGIIAHLKEKLEPRHVCFTMSIGDKVRTMERLERIGRMPEVDESEAWEHHYLNGTSRIIKDLCEAWAPETISIHGMTAENIPAVFSRKTTIYFNPTPPAESACCNEVFWRADVRAAEIADGVGLVGDDEEVVIVGTDELVTYDGIKEEVEGGTSLEERVWQRFPQPYWREFIQSKVSFVSRDDSAKCWCCGRT